MKWLITGGRGQLGSALTTLLQSRPGESVAALGSEDFDIRDAARVSEMLDRHQPDVMVNAAAYNFVDRAETEVKEAFDLNAFAPRTLARECASRGILLVHGSTNFVFDGQRRKPYRETDRANPLNVYSLSKLAGEMFVRHTTPKHLIIRSSGLYGRPTSPRSKKNFVELMLERADSAQAIKVVKDQVLTPTSCVDLAAAFVALVARKSTGLFHITNSGSCSWADFAKRIFQIAKKKPRLIRVTTRSFAATAERPLYTVLSNAKVKALGISPLRPWEDALKNYLLDRRNHTS